jgi:hypothetical protein
VNRQVIYKAYLRKRKDELRAEERRKLRERQREEVRLVGEARLREEARHRAEYKDQGIVLCSFFMHVVYFFIMCSFFLSDNLSSLDKTKAY